MDKKNRIFIVSVLLSCLFICAALASNTGKFKKFTANVMAPLNLPTAIYSIDTNIDWTTGETLTQDNKNNYQSVIDQFQNNIKAAAAIGVDAISMDVWWGLVEKNGDQQFNWDPYKKIFTMITNAGLEIQAIMSFHACGGGVGDNVNIPIPSWIWGVAGNGAKYCNEQFIGQNYNESTYGNPEIVALWASNNKAVHKQYQEYMDSFEGFVSENEFADDIQAISISCGPAGECRYPSYDQYTANSKKFGQGYPTRGYFQCYSKNAIASFQSAMQNKYGNIATLNAKWNTKPKLTSFSQVSPPTNGDGFFTSNSYFSATYGTDFIGWYNSELVTHGQKMITDGLTAFDAALAGVTVGIKIPGVHWLMGSTTMPRSTEVCAGLLNNNFVVDVYSKGCGQGYNGLMSMIKTNDSESRKVNVYFTCLEMPNADSSPAYSWACTLVYGVGKQANKIKLQIKGENALAPNSGWNWNGSPLSGTPIGNKTYGGGPWCNINYAICNGYDGITILRVSDVTYGNNKSQYGNFYGLIKLHSENTRVPKDLPPLQSESEGTM